MSTRAPDEALDLISAARTYGSWLDRPVPDELLREVYELMKWGPTSMNGCPLRIVFLRTKESKERPRSALAPGNVQKTMSAPVTAILGNDMKFYDKLPKLMPHNPKATSFFETSPEVAEVTARRNATLPSARARRCCRALA
jgi:3-hydroxypropanoate dehydrogenase